MINYIATKNNIKRFILKRNFFSKTFLNFNLFRKIINFLIFLS